MRARLMLPGLCVGILLGCGGDAGMEVAGPRAVDPPAVSPPAVSPPVVSPNGASGGAPANVANDEPAASPGTGAAGTGAAGQVGVEPAGAAGSADDEAPIAPPEPGGPAVVTFEPGSIEVFSLPINSVRTAAAGFDPVARVCASIVWDYSNNDLDYERRCGDLLAQFRPFQPYVLLSPDRDAPCSGLWEYDGLAPTSVSGCIDPIEGLVNAEIEVEAAGTRYLIHATNDASL